MDVTISITDIAPDELPDVVEILSPCVVETFTQGRYKARTAHPITPHWAASVGHELRRRFPLNPEAPDA